MVEEVAMQEPGLESGDALHVAVALVISSPIILYLIEPEKGWLLRKQRAWLSAIRSWCFSNEGVFLKGQQLVSGGEDYDMSKASFFMCSISASAFLFEGRLAMSVLLFAASVLLRRPAQSSNSQMLRRIGIQVFLVVQISLLSSDQSRVTLSVIRHALRVLMVQVLMIESLAEAFCISVASSFAMGSMLPIGLYFGTLLPFHVLNLRAFLASRKFVEIVKRSDAMSIYALLVPVMTMLFAAVAAPSLKFDRETLDLSAKVIGFLHGVLFLVCMAAGNSVDRAIMPAFCELLAKTEDPASLEHWDQFISHFMLYSSIIILGSATSASCLGQDGCKSQTALVLTGGLAVTSICLALGVIHFRVMELRSPQTRRLICFSAHLCVLLFVLACGTACEMHVVALTTTRVFLAVERRRFSLVQRKNALCGALSLLATGATLATLVSMFISITTMAIGTISCLSREAVTSIYRQKMEMHGYLSHALKQKFSCVGSALESILFGCGAPGTSDAPQSQTVMYRRILPQTDGVSRSLPAGEEGAVEYVRLDRETFLMLMRALRECRRGYDECTAVNVTHLLQTENFHSTPTLRKLSSVLNEWRDKLALDVDDIALVTLTKGFELTEDRATTKEPRLYMDWDLLRLMLATWISSARILHVTREGTVLRFRVEGGASRPVNSVIAATLGATYENGRDLMLLASTAMHVDTSSTTSSLPEDGVTSDASSIGASPTLTPGSLAARLDALGAQEGPEQAWRAVPHGLVFAVLDDNALARKNVEQICARLLQGSPASFARGSSLADCRFFPHEICARQCDVAIFDERLDFDDRLPGGTSALSGSALAAQARQLGFQGCVILHSAHALSLSRSLKPGAVFDGFVEKSASRSAFTAGVEAAWAHASRRQAAKSTQNSAQGQVS